jgi:predicted NUDIX family NTP pyrophosphohydrolase
MNEKISAGLLMYSFKSGGIKFFLVHPGGPYFKNKDEGYWSIPKGLSESEEDLLDTAKREFNEETGLNTSGNIISLDKVKQKNNKTVYAWAFESQLDNPVEIICNTFEMEWPPKSGRKQSFPEVDKGNFFALEEAKIKIIREQEELLHRLLQTLK